MQATNNTDILNPEVLISFEENQVSEPIASGLQEDLKLTEKRISASKPVMNPNLTLIRYQLTMNPEGWRALKKDHPFATKLSFTEKEGWKKNYDDQIIRQVMKNLKYFSKLQTIRLDLTSAREITEKGFRNLIEELRHFPFLQNLSLRFLSPRGITDNGIRYLSKEELQFFQTKRYIL